MGALATIDRRAQAALGETLRRFDRYLAFDGGSGRWSAQTGHRLQAKTITVEQPVIRRLLGRLYPQHWIWRCDASLGEASGTLRLRYRGWRAATRQLLFQGQGALAPLADRLNADPALMALCRENNWLTLNLRYDPATQQAETTLRPDFGDYVWLLVPPMSYVRQPEPREVKALVELIYRISVAIDPWGGQGTAEPKPVH